MQRVVIALNCVLVAVAMTAAGALAFYHRELTEIPRVPLARDTLDSTADSSEPRNYLLVGVDNAEGIDPNDPLLVGRNETSLLSDSIMILRVDPNAEKAYLLSLPRDLWVPIGNGQGKGRINEALALGGPQLLIETIKNNFGIPIHHYVQVNFNGFRSLVDGLGGVPIYFNHPARDANTGLYVDTAGCQVLDGEQALAFARSRYYEAQVDGRWVDDTSSDFGRIKRQQAFIKAAMKRAIEKGARNPVQLADMIGVAQEHVVLDDSLTPQDLIDVGTRFDSFDPEELEVYSLGDYAEGGWAGAAAVLFLDETAAQPVLDVFRGINILFDAPATARVQVRNGAGVSGQATQVGQQLDALGFTVTGTSNEASFRNETTVVRHAPGAEIQAVLVARFLESDATIEVDPSLQGTDSNVALITGRDFAGVRVEPRPLEEFAAYLPTTTTAPSATQTTQYLTFVPEPPEGVTC